MKRGTKNSTINTGCRRTRHVYTWLSENTDKHGCIGMSPRPRQTATHKPHSSLALPCLAIALRCRAARAPKQASSRPRRICVLLHHTVSASLPCYQLALHSLSLRIRLLTCRHSYTHSLTLPPSSVHVYLNHWPVHPYLAALNAAFLSVVCSPNHTVLPRRIRQHA